MIMEMLPHEYFQYAICECLQYTVIDVYNQELRSLYGLSHVFMMQAIHLYGLLTFCTRNLRKVEWLTCFSINWIS